MALVEIKLERAAWQFDESDRLGPRGGFGEVFRGAGSDGPVAIKRLNISAGAAAHRELSIGKFLASKSLSHVVPILDYGQDADSDRYFIVMPICDESLQDKIKREGTLSWDAAQPILLDIIAGLEEVGDIVHRDLKPGNVLLHDARWKIADFGIAKFVEDSTSRETLRDSLTPSYAAPEQWLGQRPNAATDVYALGCIIHALLSGKPPFGGDLDTVREAHLHTTPPPLLGVMPRLASLVNAMLRKSQDARPSIERCKHVIREVQNNQRPASAFLAGAALKVSNEEAEKEARHRQIESERLSRAAMLKESISIITELMNRLFAEIEDSSELVRRAERSVSLGPAHLEYTQPYGVSVGGGRPVEGWDLVAGSIVHLSCQLGPQSYTGLSTYTFSANLVYCTTPDDSQYRWRELSFWSFNSDNSTTPFAIEPHDRSFVQALSKVVGMVDIAHGPFTIDAEDEDAFIERWIKLFAKAAHGRLRHPGQMPPPPSFFEP